MARKYTHLDLGEREVIRRLRVQGYTVSEIARAISRSKSTVSREVLNHMHHNGYEPDRAHGRARKLCKLPRRPEKMMVPQIAKFVKKGLELGWSPEQIAGRIRKKYRKSPQFHISHQCICDWIYRTKKAGQKWHMLLRINGRKRYRRRARGNRKDQIPNRKGIELRPKSVETRRFFGDWEGDTVAGAKASKGRLVTLVERKSLFTVIAKMETGKPQCLNDAVVARMGKQTDLPLRTITVDNGVEFLRHEELSQQLHASIFFAKPYCSWQRGLNENTNGLLRQYFPKGINFQLVDEEHIARVENLLNNRPRKKLGYRTPAEVMAKFPKSRVVPLLI